MRTLYDPSVMKNGSRASVAEGGTGETDSLAAAETLGLVTGHSVGTGQGPVLLDAQGSINVNQKPAGVLDPNLPVLSGPLSVYANFSGLFKITNFDSTKSYAALSTLGTVVLNGEDVTFTAGTQPGKATITVNGVAHPFTVLPIPIQDPTITSPSNGVSNITDHLTITATPFTTTAPDTQASTDWQLASDAAFTSIVQQSMADTVNKSSWSISGLSPRHTYYVRVRYTGVLYKNTNWSPTVKFSTLTSFVPAMPTITSPLSAVANLTKSFTITASAFSSPSGDTWAATDWQVGIDPLFSGVVAQSLGDTVNKSSWTVSGLNFNAVYYLRVRYKGAIYGYGPWSPTVEVGTQGSALLGIGIDSGAGGGAGGGALNSYGSGYGGGQGAHLDAVSTIHAGDVFDVVVGAGGLGGTGEDGAAKVAPTPGGSGGNSTVTQNAGQPWTAVGSQGGQVVNVSNGWTGGNGWASWIAAGGLGGKSWDTVNGIATAYSTLNGQPGGTAAGGGGGAAVYVPGGVPSWGNVGGNGAPGGGGEVILEYDAGLPKATQFSTATYSLVNGKHRFTFLSNGQLTIPSFVPNTPSVVSPADGTGNLPTGFTIVSTAFSSPTTYDAHYSTDWQVAADVNFLNILKQSLGDTVNKTALAISGLSNGQLLFIRVRYNGTLFGTSSWSPVIAVSTVGTILGTVTARGGGGSGGGGATIPGNDVYPSGGGGSGYKSVQSASIGSGAVLNFTVGLGGAAPVSSQNSGYGPAGNTGGTTTVTGPSVSVTASGGKGGAGASYYGPVAGGSGAYSGAATSDKYTAGSGGGTGGAAAAGINPGGAGTNGFVGGSHTSLWSSGYNYGSGGGGGGDLGNGANATGVVSSYYNGGDGGLGGGGGGGCVGGSVPGKGGDGYGMLEYSSSYPKAVSFTGATYSLVNGNHRYTFLTNGTLTMPSFVPATPSITSPTDGTTGVVITQAFTSSAYSNPMGGALYASDWQVATDSGFVNIFAQSLNDTVNKTSWSVTGLPENSSFYVRVRYKDTVYGTSAWSAGVKFSTLASYEPLAPSVVSPANGTGGVVLNMTFWASAFSSPIGAGFNSSDWQLATDVNFVNVVQQVIGTASTGWSVGSLAAGTTYYVRARYRDSAGRVSPWGPAIYITTASSYGPNTPSIVALYESIVPGSFSGGVTQFPVTGSGGAYPVFIAPSGYSSLLGTPQDTVSGNRYIEAYISTTYNGSNYSEMIDLFEYSSGSGNYLFNTNLPTGGTMMVQIRYVDSSGRRSGWSNVASFNYYVY